MVRPPRGGGAPKVAAAASDMTRSNQTANLFLGSNKSFKNVFANASARAEQAQHPAQYVQSRHETSDGTEQSTTIASATAQPRPTPQNAGPTPVHTPNQGPGRVDHFVSSTQQAPSPQSLSSPDNAQYAQPAKAQSHQPSSASTISKYVSAGNPSRSQQDRPDLQRRPSSVLPSPTPTDEASPSNQQSHASPTTLAATTLAPLDSRQHRAGRNQGASPQVNQQAAPAMSLATPIPNIPQPFAAWIQRLASSKESFGDTGRSPTGGARYALVMQACKAGDLDCLVLHQLGCIWCQNPTLVENVLGVKKDSLQEPFTNLQQVLAPSDSMEYKLLQFFSSFPITLASFEDRASSIHKSYMDSKRRIRNFLLQMRHWPQWQQSLLSRRFPFLVGEIIDYLHLVSPVMQEVVFTFSRRYIGIPDGPAGLECRSVFKRDQKRAFTGRYHQDQESTWRLSTSPADQEADWRLLTSLTYKSIVARHTQSLSPRLSDPDLRLVNSAQISASPAGTPLAQQTGQPPVQSPIMQAPQVPQGFVLPSNQASQNNNALHIKMPGHAQQVAQLAAQRPSPRSPLSPGSGQSQFQLHPGMAQRRGTVANTSLHEGNGPAGSDVSPQNSTIGQLVHQQPYQSRLQQGTGYPQFISAPYTPPTIATPQRAAPRRSSTHHFSGQPSQGLQSPGIYSGQPHGVVHRDAREVPRKRPADEPIFPPANFKIMASNHPLGPADSRAVTNALHQVDVRSPQRCPVDITKVRLCSDGRYEPYYQFVETIVVGPTRVRRANKIQHFEFNVQPWEYEMLCKTTLDGVFPRSLYFDNSTRYRLRFCQFKADREPPQEGTWVTTPTSWPKHLAVAFNNNGAQKIRRKQHNGKDLPMELTPRVISGKNLLEVSRPDYENDHEDFYFLAVEKIITMRQSQVMDKVLRQPHMALETAKQEIVRRLGADSSDDEISAVQSDMKLNLADPFMMKMFTTPVRGVDCRHLECFDLQVWLDTRERKRDAFATAAEIELEPSHADKWACPICGEDARPQSLRIDDFMVGVRNSLLQQSMGNVKAVTLSADASWKPIIPDDDDDDEGDGAAIPRVEASRGPVDKVVAKPAVIVIDDDD